MKCKYCFKICHKFGLINHELYCKLNPNKKSREGKNNPNYGNTHTGSNQFIKAKETGTFFIVSEKTKTKISKGQTGKTWTKERKDNHKLTMSRVAKENPTSYSASNVNGRVKKIEYNGILLDGGWELLFVQWLDSNNIKWIRNIEGFQYEWNGIRTYYPDFYLPDFKKYVEVKGYMRERDLIKWKSVKNLIVIDKESIKIIKNGNFKLF